jgi:hypothetical protein
MEADPKGGNTAAPAKKRKLQVSSLLPIVAFGLSVFSLYVSESARKDVARLEEIKTEYGLFHDLAQMQLQHPSMAHLFAPTNEIYDLNVAGIKASLVSVSEQERARMLLEERAVAHYLFTTFEEAFFLWQQAAAGDDRHREEMALEDLAYFKDTICNNPRLLWYWDFRGGKLDRAFAPELNKYYRDNVLKNKDCQEISQDSTGPFGPREEEE